MFIKIWKDDNTIELIEFIEIHFINDVICILTMDNEMESFCKKDIQGFKIGYASCFKVEQSLLEGE